MKLDETQNKSGMDTPILFSKFITIFSAELCDTDIQIHTHTHTPSFHAISVGKVFPCLYIFYSIYIPSMD